MKKLSIGLAALALTAALGAAAQAPSASLYGRLAPLTSATRSIVILPTTRYVNVTQGEVIRFVIDGAEFAFSFNGPNTAAFDLRRVAPEGALKQAVTAYVRIDPDAEGLIGH
jgi:hypothetical protein